MAKLLDLRKFQEILHVSLLQNQYRMPNSIALKNLQGIDIKGSENVSPIMRQSDDQQQENTAFQSYLGQTASLHPEGHAIQPSNCSACSEKPGRGNGALGFPKSRTGELDPSPTAGYGVSGTMALQGSAPSQTLPELLQHQGCLLRLLSERQTGI